MNIFSKMGFVTFGELIRKKRLELGLPIREVASQLELDQSVLSKIERNIIRAPSRIVLPLSVALHLDYEYLQKNIGAKESTTKLKSKILVKKL